VNHAPAAARPQPTGGTTAGFAGGGARGEARGSAPAGRRPGEKGAPLRREAGEASEVTR
jgi:hypothetical protein